MTGQDPGPSSRVRWAPGEVTVADRWTYAFDRPCHPRIHPLRAPSGPVLTVDAPDDHPWHHGLWFTIKFVDGVNYWEELGGHGVLLHRDDPPVAAAEEAPAAGDDAGPDGNGAGVTVAGWIDWLDPDGTSVPIRELCRLTHRPRGDDAYAIDVAVELHARRALTLDREPFNGLWGGYSGLTFRGRPDLVDTVITLADGPRSDRVLGEPSPWLDLSGTVEGVDAGILLMDDPRNPRHPVPWYVSTRAATYGDDGWSNFANAALLWNEPLLLAAGEILTLRHRVVVHDGRWDGARAEAEWQAWRAESGDGATP